MTDEERDIITRFIQRVGGAPQAVAPGSVPATLPPVDPDADRLIGDLFTQNPGARYRLTQTAFVQEHALAEAQNQISRLQYALQQAQTAQQAQPQQIAPPAPSPWGAAAPTAQPAPQQSRSLFGGLFGGGPQPQYAPPQQPQYAPPPPQYAPGYQPGMFQRQGSGFLGSALTTAAGVAGGMVAGNALMNMFSGNHGGGMFGGGGFGQQPQVVEYINNDPQGGNDQGGNDQGGSPWSDGSGGGAGSDGGWQDQGSTDPGIDPSSDPGSDGGWDDSGSDDIQNT
jgi:hypothetical protein